MLWACLHLPSCAKRTQKPVGGGRLLSLKSAFRYSEWVMSNANDLVLTESNVRPRKLWPGVLMMTQERSRACLPPVESRHSSSGQALPLEQGGRGTVLCTLVGPGSLSFLLVRLTAIQDPLFPPGSWLSTFVQWEEDPSFRNVSSVLSSLLKALQFIQMIHSLCSAAFHIHRSPS